MGQVGKWLLLAGLFAAGCIRPAEDRAALDLEVGVASAEGIALEVDRGLAAVRSISRTEALLWGQAPVLDIVLDAEEAGSLRLEVLNCMPDALAQIAGSEVASGPGSRLTHCVFDLELEAGENQVRIAPPDADVVEPYKIAVMGDIQTALDEVDDVFLRISANPELRFVLSTGDITDRAEISEYALYEEQLATLDIPYYSTIGNHELTRDPDTWHRRYGLYSIHFDFKGAHFSFVDSGNASLDPALHARLGTWLDEASDKIHLFGTHYPLLDPVGTRNSAFRSRFEAAKLLTELARGSVDLTLYGHIHSYYEFQNASIPAYISGGGGALPERLDGIDRHFLVIDLDPQASQVREVSVTRID
jgi:hypothetical protein